MRFALFVCALISCGLILGFLIFAVSISRLQAPTNFTKADGIVVWTGKGGDRVKAGVRLLIAKRGERLLISGTNPDLSREAILKGLEIETSLADCCIDMDQASNTIENAQQTANWAKALDYKHIILVTSAYHMPRAEIEIGNASGRLAITSYPVRADDAPTWWKSPSQLKRLLQEYGKLLLSFIRNNHERGTPPPKP